MENQVISFATAALRLLPGGRRASTPQRILVIRMGNLGDIIVALPAFRALRARFPEAHMTLLTSPTKRGAPGAKEVLEQDNIFDHQIVYYEDESSQPAFLRELRSKIAALQIDLAIVLPDDLTSAKSMLKYFVLLGSAGVRRVAGDRLVTAEEANTGQVPRLMRLIAPLGAKGICPPPWIAVQETSREKAAQLLAAAKGHPLIGMQCGAKRPANRWMPERFIEVGRHLVEQHDAWIVLTGSPGERELTTRVQEGIGPRCLNLAGETSIPELAAVAGQCTAFLSNDTGTMHVAAAMGTPVVAVFSARDRKFRWYPYGEQHQVLRTDIDCSPCLADVCPKYDAPECLNRIGVQAVTQALDKILTQGAH